MTEIENFAGAFAYAAEIRTIATDGELDSLTTLKGLALAAAALLVDTSLDESEKYSQEHIDGGIEYFNALVKHTIEFVTKDLEQA